MWKWGWGAAALALTASLAWAVPGAVGGTFHKGPSIGGRQNLAGPVLQIRDELGTGDVVGGLFTGTAKYTIREEIINFAGTIGTLHARIVISKENGSVIEVGLDGITVGADAAAQTVTVQGSWRVLSATGPDAGLQGNGTFTGTENFVTGETSGTFTGHTQ